VLFGIVERDRRHVDQAPRRGALRFERAL